MTRTVRVMETQHLMTFRVLTDHKPRPKGSLTPERGVGGRIRMKESVDPAGVWRAAIANAARAEARLLGMTEPWDFPMVMRTVLLFRRPVGTEWEYPARRQDGDVEKLYRNISDALQDAHVITDDARIVGHQDSWKIWAPNGGPGGAVVSLYRAPAVMTDTALGIFW